MRDRLLLARDLLAPTGSIFVQISDANVHHIRSILDEVFGVENFVSAITFQKTTSSTGDRLSSISDYLLWYCKDITKLRYRQLYFKKEFGSDGSLGYNRVILPDGTKRNLKKEEIDDLSKIPRGSRIYKIDNLSSTRPAGEGATFVSMNLMGKIILQS